jgi:hypothetical protein
MHSIKKLADAMKDEIEGAKDYAEDYVEAKARGDMATANKYKEMALDELKHANYEHEWAVNKIQEVSKIYTAPVEMQEKWEHSHKEYVEKVAWIRQMLAM